MFNSNKYETQEDTEKFSLHDIWQYQSGISNIQLSSCEMHRRLNGKKDTKIMHLFVLRVLFNEPRPSVVILVKEVKWRNSMTNISFSTLVLLLNCVVFFFFTTGGAVTNVAQTAKQPHQERKGIKRLKSKLNVFLIDSERTFGQSSFNIQFVELLNQ